MTSQAQNITLALGGRWNGRYGQVRCPCHDDGSPSLQISDDPNKSDGIVVHCHAGCDWKDVKDEFRRRGLMNGELKPNGRATYASQAERRYLVETYNYENLSGEFVYRKHRYDPKGFSQERPDGEGGWIKNLNGTKRFLYHAVEVDEAVANEQPVFLVEGEKAADRMRCVLGVVATCSTDKPDNWRQVYGAFLEGARRDHHPGQGPGG